MSHSGNLNTRSLTRVGWSWEEQFFFKWDEAGRQFMAQIINWHRAGSQLDVAHQDLTLLGDGGGTPLVNGADQTGQTINTDGWPASTGVLKAGDFVTFAGIDTVYQIWIDETSDAGGAVALTINPPIYDGGSPADGAAITVTDSVVFKAKILNLEVPSFGPDMFVAPRITWAEDV